MQFVGGAGTVLTSGFSVLRHAAATSGESQVVRIQWPEPAVCGAGVGFESFSLAERTIRPDSTSAAAGRRSWPHPYAFVVVEWRSGRLEQVFRFHFWTDSFGALFEWRPAKRLEGSVCLHDGVSLVPLADSLFSPYLPYSSFRVEKERERESDSLLTCDLVPIGINSRVRPRRAGERVLQNALSPGSGVR